MTGKKNMPLAELQINSVYHKLAKLFSLNSFFLVFLTETWLDENVSDSEIFLGSSYTIISRSDRPQGQHGGILIAVSNHCGSTLVDISLKQYPFSVGCCLSETELKLLSLYPILHLPLISKSILRNLLNVYMHIRKHSWKKLETPNGTFQRLFLVTSISPILTGTL